MLPRKMRIPQAIRFRQRRGRAGFHESIRRSRFCAMASRLALMGGEPVRNRPFTRWPLFDERERAQLEDVLSSGNWGGYPSPNRKASEFAARFAEFQGIRNAIATSSGTAALEV